MFIKVIFSYRHPISYVLLNKLSYFIYSILKNGKKKFLSDILFFFNLPFKEKRVFALIFERRENFPLSPLMASSLNLGHHSQSQWKKKGKKRTILSNCHFGTLQGKKFTMPLINSSFPNVQFMCLCGTWSGCGGERVAMKWLGVG